MFILLFKSNLKKTLLILQHGIQAQKYFTKLKIAQNVFVPLLQLYNSFRTPNIE